MRFTLLDRITDLQPGVRLEGIKNLSLAEEYLADHFPLFPVMPGVLMLEAMTQAGAWLVRATDDFAHSMVVLRGAQTVKYADFVSPGQSLTVTAEVLDRDGSNTKIKAEGRVDGKVNVQARLLLGSYNLADDDPDRAATDAVVRGELRRLFSILYPASAVAGSPS